MTEPPTRTDFSPSLLRTAIIGLLATIVVVDSLLLVAKPGAEFSEPVRVLLAAGAFGVNGLCFSLGTHSPKYGDLAVVSTPVVLVYAYTGLLLPWTELSFYVGQLGIEMLLGIPFVGEWLAVGVFGGFTLTEANLQTAFRNHYAILALAAVTAVAAIVASSGEGQRIRSG